MGLDQYLNIVITTDKTTANRQEINNIAQKLNTLLPNYSFNNQYSPSYLDNDDMISEFDLDPIYDIDGNSTNRYELLTVRHTEYSYRKANQIQNYFEEKFYEGGNETDNQDYNYVNTKIDDFTIKDILNRIDKINNHPTIEVAEEEFPTTEGFFYGDTDYNKYYFEQNNDFADDLTELQKIRNQINNQLENTPYKAIIEYSSWW